MANPEGMELQASHDRFQLLVEGTRDYAILMLNPDGLIASWNAGAQNIKGYTASEVIGQHFRRFYPEADQAAGKPEAELVTARATGRFEEEGWRVRKDGSLFWASVVITALFDGQNNLRGFGKVTRDLTERRKAEEQAVRLKIEQAARVEAERVQAELLKITKQKDELLALLSHELRTPLNAISGSAAMLRELPADSDEFRQFLELIEQNALAQAEVIGSILDASSLFTGSMAIERGQVDLQRILDEARGKASLAAEARGIKVVCAGEPVPVLVTGDAARLRQVFWSVLNNAVKFSPTGGTVRVVTERRGAVVAVQIQDSGAGIAADFLPYVFEMFRQEDASSKRKYGGLGLGLAVARHIAELHGGSIEAANRGDATGAVFTVELPVLSAARSTV